MYRRFLNRNDYLAIITEQALDQLVRGREDRFMQAEQAAEASIIDYLAENYEIEKELSIGKYISNYDSRVTYPVGVYFYKDNQICETIKAINGYKAPTSAEYWIEISELLENPDEIAVYSQMATYQPGTVVRRCNQYFKCMVANGFDFNDIRIPGINAWTKVETVQWDSIPYNLWDVVEYDGQFFTLMTMEGFDQMVNPMDSDCWGLIGDYDPNYNQYELSDHEYVVFGQEVFFPIINPNAEDPQLEINIRYNDPRNYNLKRHMVQLALYELHKLISPVNISTVRIDDYEHSMQWLKDASRLKLNPQIPRKIDKRDGQPVTDWQMATFQVSYDPYTNPWHI